MGCAEAEGGVHLNYAAWVRLHGLCPRSWGTEAPTLPLPANEKRKTLPEGRGTRCASGSLPALALSGTHRQTCNVWPGWTIQETPLTC